MYLKLISIVFFKVNRGNKNMHEEYSIEFFNFMLFDGFSVLFLGFILGGGIHHMCMVIFLFGTNS